MVVSQESHDTGPVVGIAAVAIILALLLLV
jgi:hypothetical protein